MSKGHYNAVRALEPPKGGSGTAPPKNDRIAASAMTVSSTPAQPTPPADTPPLVLRTPDGDWTAKHAEFFWLLTRMVTERKVTTDVAAQVAARLLS